MENATQQIWLALIRSCWCHHDPRRRPTLPIKFHAGWVSDLIEILCLILKHFIGPPLNMLGLRHLDIFIFQYIAFRYQKKCRYRFQQHEGPWKVALLMLVWMVKMCFEKNLGHTFNFIKVVCQSSWKNSCNLFIFYRTIKLLTLLFWRNNHATLGSTGQHRVNGYKK